MNFHHLAYWQDKALSLAIENRLFINGEYTAAAENETFETVDPVTQAPLAKIARGKSVDIDRAVSAARGVFERGDWSLSSPAKRKAVLNKLADLMEAHAEELALLETLDTGKPIRHSLLDYYRLTADNRLLYGGGVVYGARDPDDVERLVVPKLLKTFPQLKGVKIDYRWTGNFLLTLSRMPQFGRLDTNIYYMQGYSGHGVTCTHLAGRLIAELLRGDAERFDAFANLPHYPFPGGRTLRVPFTAMGAAYYSLRDRLGV
ncbi:aldehyde dehydrogenase family protein [Escherichia coli]|nr:aldehyde dehydrogenase family protein [Escherichia coli]